MEVVMRAAVALGSFLALGGAFAVGLKAAPAPADAADGVAVALTYLLSVSTAARLGRTR